MHHDPKFSECGKNCKTCAKSKKIGQNDEENIDDLEEEKEERHVQNEQTVTVYYDPTYQS